jgi:hypothetical protein
VATPSIILSGGTTTNGLSAYHPVDKEILESKALYWIFGLRRALLQKTKGLCALCNCNILDESWEIHHKKPRAYGGKNDISNLIPLCKPCHRSITKAVAETNMADIELFEQYKVLDSVSTSINLVKFKKLNSKNSLPGAIF